MTTVWRHAINLVAGVYFAAIVIFAVPMNLPAQHQLRAWIEPAMRATGTWQSWDMFAPHPPTANVWLVAAITWDDGSVDEHEFPRLSEMGYFEIYPGENFNKAEEWIRADQFKATWPDVAAWVLRTWPSPGKTATRVELATYSQMIPKFNAHNAQIFPAPLDAPKRVVIYAQDLGEAP